MSSQRDQVEVTEDLKAFERRLTEYISGLHPKAVRWRIVFAMSSICTIFSTWFWITDETMANVTFLESLWNHKFFSTNIFILILLLLIGIHKRVREPQTILKRCRLVLDDYNMSCDDRGKLILKPRTSLQDKYPSHAR
ncbi:nuclear envelope phosphatase-regulatory subunit 1-like isoform X1 [Dendronephthya gigantea]|uniref:nuclear envelope phosphatase-regulatory subunit 1-like isoform X1 n=1 Tax=Dendronephthya gigantea TaxID=151771 RepID=UPI00106C9378|nr:nuclear envelope phosphatase-regulatory subunit 1-like isoform X1 [Dendronephthya gigantea]